MPTTLTQKIQEFCTSHDIQIPPGFKRHAPSRYAVIVINDDARKLIAKTWFTVEDLVYYVEHNLKDREHRVFDFEQMNEIRIKDSRSTEVVAPIGPTADDI